MIRAMPKTDPHGLSCLKIEHPLSETTLGISKHNTGQGLASFGSPDVKDLDLRRLPLEIKDNRTYISNLYLKNSCNHQVARPLESTEGIPAGILQAATMFLAQNTLRNPNNLVPLSRRSENLILVQYSRPTGSSSW